jgi:hypothetical protein
MVLLAVLLICSLAMVFGELLHPAKKAQNKTIDKENKMLFLGIADMESGYRHKVSFYTLAEQYYSILDVIERIMVL